MVFWELLLNISGLNWGKFWFFEKSCGREKQPSEFLLLFLAPVFPGEKPLASFAECFKAKLSRPRPLEHWISFGAMDFPKEALKEAI